MTTTVNTTTATTTATTNATTTTTAMTTTVNTTTAKINMYFYALLQYYLNNKKFNNETSTK
jgi:hypothetical protein